MKFIKYFVYIIIALFVVFTTFKKVVTHKFKLLEKPPFYDSNEKVWAHRGYTKNLQDNSIASFTKGFELGAPGTEMDIFYDVDSARFIVSHDFPYIQQDGKLLYLEQVFQHFGSGKYYWLDFKKLSHLSRQETHQAAQNLSLLINKYGLENHCIIEGEKPQRLGMFAKAGLPTSYWIKLKEKDPSIKFTVEKAGILFNIIWHHFSAVSMRDQYYTPKVEKALQNMPVHLFTVNDSIEIKQFMGKKNVKVILTDNNFYNIQ